MLTQLSDGFRILWFSWHVMHAGWSSSSKSFFFGLAL